MENQRASSSENTSAVNFGQMLSDLTRPQAFQLALADDEVISVIQTHASAVILTSNYAYKLKKTVRFRFLRLLDTCSATLLLPARGRTQHGSGTRNLPGHRPSSSPL